MTPRNPSWVKIPIRVVLYSVLLTLMMFSASLLVGIPVLVISWVTAICYVPKIPAGIAAGRAG